MKKFDFKLQYRSFIVFTILSISNFYGQIGDLIWSDEFNTFNTNIWNADVGNGCEIGLCGWGNAELEYYRPENLTIEAIPGESGNNALVMEAKRESFEGFEFTSGKVTSEGNLSVHYGMIEIRMQTPPVETGLWPAAWLLGTANLVWPAKGEIDMMEMGHRDEEITNQGHPGTNQDNYVGANAIFANEDGSVGSIAYDVNYNKPYVASTSMANRFMTYRLYWEPTQLRLTVIDNGVENDLYEGPLPLSSDSVTSVFQKPFFLLMNLAVGGNFTDAAIPNEVTASLPSKLYIDYVRVYEWNGFGTVEFDYDELEAETGPFGVYTENTPVNNELSFGLDSEIYVWGGTMQDGTSEPFEGNEVIAWETLNPNSWFGGGISSTFGRDMSGYVEDGVLKFNLKVPADLSFRIGITDNFTNESWLEFPANESNYGLVRNGEWSEIEIPLIDFAGLIAFQDINYMFAISSLDGAFPTSSVQIGIDNIIWDDGNGVSTSIPVDGVSVSPTISSLSVGDSIQLNETISPADATNQNVVWSSNNVSVATVNANGLVTAVSSGNAVISVTTEDGAFEALANITVSTSNTGTFPDPSKRYYIDNRRWNVRLGADGEQDAFTTTTSTTGENVEWTITPSPTDGYYYIDCVGGGNVPRLRSDQQTLADMQATTSGGTWTRWMFTDVGDGYYYLSTLNESNFMRLQVNGAGDVRTVAPNFTGNWTHFTFTEVEDDNTNSNLNLRIEAEDYTTMNGVLTETTTDIGGGINVGWIDPNDWLEYTVTTPASGNYTLNLRVASPNAGANVTLQVNGTNAGNVQVPITGGWQNWQTISTSINLEAGTQTVRLTSTADSFNINWLEVTNTAAKSINSEILSQISFYPNPVVDQLNIELGEIGFMVDGIEVITINGQTLNQTPFNGAEKMVINTANYAPGIYLVRIKSKNQTVAVKKFIK